MKFLYNKGFLQNFAAILIAVLLIIGASVINLSKPSPVYATSCSVYDGNQGSCTGTTGCTWNDSCSSFNGNQGSCEGTNGCSYPASSGDCSAFSDAYSCSLVPSCTTGTLDCSTLSDGGGDGAACMSAGCSYDGGDGSCTGVGFNGCTGTYDTGECTGTMTTGLCTGDFDDTAPALSSLTVIGNSLTLTYDEALDSGSTPATTDFTVYVDLTPVSIYSVSVTGTTVIVTLTQDVGIGTAVTIDYTPASTPIQDSAGNDASSMTGQVVTNNSLPTISSVSPSSSSSINNVTTSGVSFTVDTNLASGSITATRTGGSADGNSPHACTLRGTGLNSGTHTIDFSDTINGCNTDVSNLVSGADYTFVFEGTDAGNNVADPVTVTNVRFDNTAPATPGIPDLVAGSDLGSSSTDNITSDNTPTFDISCESGATVRLHLNDNTQLGTGTCSEVGAISITSSALSGGTNIVKAVQIDTAGNSSTYSSTLSITVDTTRPSTSGIPDLDAGSDTGPSSTDNNTSDLTPTFTITCDDSSAIVTLDVAGTVLGTGACNGSTATITSTSRPTGPNNFRSKQTDLAGNDSLAYSEYLSISIGNTVPAAPGTPDLATGSDLGSSSTDNNTSDNTPTFDISCGGNDLITLKEGSNTLGTGSCFSSTVTITSSTLSDGTFSIKAIRTNTYGIDSVDSSTLSVTIDATVPTVSLTAPADGATVSGASVAVSADASDTNLAGVQFKRATNTNIGSEDTTSAYSVTWDVTGLSDGSQTLIAVARDTAGNYATSTSRTVTVNNDSTAPTISSVTSNKADGSYTVGEVIDIDVLFSEAVTSTGDVTVTLETGTTDRTCTFTVSSGTTGTCNYTVQSGDTTSDLTIKTISGTIADAASNAMSDFIPASNLAATSALVIDTTAPSISESGAIATGTDTTPAYTFSTGEAGTISYGGSCSSVTTSASFGSNLITLDTLAVGTYIDCTVIVTDTAGNASNTLTLTSFTITAPESDSEPEVEEDNTHNISGSSPSRLSAISFVAANDSNTDSPSKKPCLNGERFNTNTGLPCGNSTPPEVPGCAFGFNFSILTGKSCNTSPISPQTPNTPNTPSTFKFLKNIPFGTIRSDDARQLQIFLNTHNFPVALTGVGSLGLETRYFGPATRAALAKFQAFSNITPALGFFGPITRNYINGL